MSLIGTVLKGAIGGFSTGGVAGGITGALGGFFGGNGGPNIANSLSQQVGCTILQADADQARAMLQRGIDPCTGMPKSTAMTAFDTGIPAQTINLDPGFAGPAPGAQAIPVGGVGMVPIPTMGGALEFTTTGLIRNVIVNGRRISRRKAAAFIRKFGFDVGARGLGISTQQAAQVVLQQSQRPRRRRGISGAQITQANRVIRTLSNFQKQLACPTRRAPVRRRKTCP